MDYCFHNFRILGNSKELYIFNKTLLFKKMRGNQVYSIKRPHDFPDNNKIPKMHIRYLEIFSEELDQFQPNLTESIFE